MKLTIFISCFLLAFITTTVNTHPTHDHSWSLEARALPFPDYDRTCLDRKEFDYQLAGEAAQQLQVDQRPCEQNSTGTYGCVRLPPYKTKIAIYMCAGHGATLSCKDAGLAMFEITQKCTDGSAGYDTKIGGYAKFQTEKGQAILFFNET